MPDFALGKHSFGPLPTRVRVYFILIINESWIFAVFKMSRFCLEYKQRNLQIHKQINELINK